MAVEDAPSSKLRSGTRFLAMKPDNRGDILATVEVQVQGYVPADVQVRERIGPTMFTALIPAGHLEKTLKDPCVVAVEPSQRLESNHP